MIENISERKVFFRIFKESFIDGLRYLTVIVSKVDDDDAYDIEVENKHIDWYLKNNITSDIYME
jgi:hypothetical protein